MNIKIVFSYDGSKYNGSQKQPEKNTIADKILNILQSVGINSKLIISGRTDKNVHAINQVANFIIPPFWTNLKKLHTIFNRQLPKSIQVHSVTKVNDKFHSRFSAKKRIYRYIISSSDISVFQSDYIVQHKNMNIEGINTAIKYFIGIHDFEYFSKKGSEPVNTTREITEARFYKYKDYYIFKFKGNSFLRSQIRIMVQILLKISDGKLTVEDLKNQLLKKEQKLITLAPPNGLYLTKIIY